MQYIGAIDQGTSSSRFIVFDRSGRSVAQHQIEVTPNYPQPGWVEHDGETIFKSVEACITAVMASLPQTASAAAAAATADTKSSAGGANANGPIAAVGITNQRETTLVWDRTTGKPLHAAIVWSDTRTAALCDELASQRGGNRDWLRATCGLPISTYFSAMKLRWLIDNSKPVSDAIANGRALFGTVDSWLIWRLTGGINGGVHVTDVSNASRTMLMSLNTREWDKTTCDALGIPMSILPRIVSNSEIYGRIAFGPLKGVVISGCLGDQQAALLGQLCIKPGTCKNTYGTGCFMLMNTGTGSPVQSTHGLLTTVAFQLGPNEKCHYALEGSVAVAGSAVQWLRNSLKLIDTSQEINTFAVDAAPNNAGIYFVPAFNGLYSPYWRDDARGVLCGLTHAAGKNEICRAVLEAAAYQTREVLDAMTRDAAAAGVGGSGSDSLRVAVLRVDGGMSASDVMCQFQSDILGVGVQRPTNAEATAAGAAYAAGLAIGYWKSVADLQSSVSESVKVTDFKPEMSDAVRATKMEGWKKAVTRSFGWVESTRDQKHIATDTVTGTGTGTASSGSGSGSGNCSGGGGFKCRWAERSAIALISAVAGAALFAVAAKFVFPNSGGSSSSSGGGGSSPSK